MENKDNCFKACYHFFILYKNKVYKNWKNNVLKVELKYGKREK